AAIDVPARYPYRESPSSAARQLGHGGEGGFVSPVSIVVGFDGYVEKMPGAPPGPVSPNAAIEICEPRPAKDARAPLASAAVTTSPSPSERVGPVPVGCRSLAGW